MQGSATVAALSTSPSSAGRTTSAQIPVMPQQVMWYPVAFTAGGQMISPSPQLCMYIVPSPGLPSVPANTPALMATPQTTPFCILPSPSPQPVPKPSFARQRSAPNLRARATPQTERVQQAVVPFVQQPVLGSPLANTASLLEKLPCSGHVTPEPRRKLHIDPLDGTWNNTEATMLASGTANSLDDALDPKEIAALLQLHEHDPVATATIEELRAELTDAGVRAKVLKLPEQVCVNMVCALERQPQLMLELCLKERGKILAHLVERLAADQSFPLVKFTLDHFLPLALSQSGCIALPRVLGGITESQRDVFFDEARKNMAVLITHPYGNYIVKHFVQLRERKYTAAVCQFLCTPDALRIVATNKFGSHVLEDVMRHSAPGDLRPMIEHAFGSAELLRQLCADSYANYCVQSMFTFMEQCDRDPTFHAFCVKQVSAASVGSRFQKNIMKRATAAFRPAPQRPRVTKK